ncbi:MAG: hypothetical protein ACD_4C00406G0002 [uncultured bacterium (gcode 4)]|uniref:Uncharacterized protein n=1 Tax=uncultured bacterium (gcode 4) TaxID=1234023 RepID=K2FTG5_9BACT|nr:MAG: hypothetical protein ACD_4C00406G0002 [uncultured bacterium (gcode 4)]
MILCFNLKYDSDFYWIIKKLKTKIENIFLDIDPESLSIIKHYLSHSIWVVIDHNFCLKIWSESTLNYAFKQIFFLERIYYWICKFNEEQKKLLVAIFEKKYHQEKNASMELDELFHVIYSIKMKSNK